MPNEVCETFLNEVCEAFLDEAMDYNDLPGLVIGVSRGDETFTGARGLRDVVTGDPLQADDIFHCASVSKLFTSSAIMLLVDAGVLSLDDRLCDILPDLFASGPANPGISGANAPGPAGSGLSGVPDPANHGLTGPGFPGANAPGPASSGLSGFPGDPHWQDVRLWQMLSHTAGIGDVTDYHWEQCLTGESVLPDYVHSKEVTGQPLLWAPGEGGFRYSNIAYEILGHIVAVKSGAYMAALPGNASGNDAAQPLSYEDFVQRYLMEPAGMTNSTMKTFERFGLQPGAPSLLLTDEIRSRNAASVNPAGSENPVSGVSKRLAGEVPGDQAAGVSGNPAAEVSGDSSVWHPMALPHEKAADRSIVPVKYYPYTRSHAPSSTLTSNAADLLRWARVHMRPHTLLSSAAYQHIRCEYAEVPNNREKMGLGWFMRRQGGYQLYGHEGTDEGFRASLWICPELDLVIVVLSNLSGAPVKRLNKQLFDRLTA